MHNTEIDYEGGLEKLAIDLGNLRYDALKEFLNKLSQKLDNDSDADFIRERYQLAWTLSGAAGALRLAKNEIEKAWEISKPYMEIK